MSYDLYLRDESGKTIEVENHSLRGGTHQIEGTREAWLNVTYNYSTHFYRTLGDKGIRSIYGMSGLDSIPVLAKAAGQLGSDETDNYWDGTEGNAKRALLDLIGLATMAPDGIWHGD